MLYDTRLDRSPAGQILKLLQQQGALNIKAIEAALGVTTTAVRQQILTLQAEGLVVAETVREKRGRPPAIYRLSDQGQALFARGYENLALALLEEVLGHNEPDSVRPVLHRVSVRLGEQYAEQLHGTGIAERLQELAALLEQHGIMSKLEEDDEAFVPDWERASHGDWRTLETSLWALPGTSRRSSPSPGSSPSPFSLSPSPLVDRRRVRPCTPGPPGSS